MDAATQGFHTVMDELKSWASQPFNPSMSLKGWAAFVGLLIILSIAWGLVLRELKL